MGRLLISLFLTLVLIVSVKAEEFIKTTDGYYYIVLKKVSPKKANNELLHQINKAGWGVVHSVNVDKTAKIDTFYKTHLLCKGKYLKQGVRIYKDIGNLIPCKMTIRVEGSKTIIMVEDVLKLAKLYNIKDKKFLKFLNKVQDELNGILIETKNKLEPTSLIPQY